MTSAKLAAIQLRRELAFLEVCEGYQERLTKAKEALAQARESGDQRVIDEAAARRRETAKAMSEFRAWARTMGKPREGVPGRDATINVGG